MLDSPQPGDCQTGILVLMPPVESWRRQIEQSFLVLIDQTATLFRRGPIFASDPQRRAKLRRLPLDYSQGIAVLRSNDDRDAPLEDAGFFRGDFFERITEKV